MSEVTGHANVRSAARDTENYSSDLQGDRDVRTYRQIPLEIDPPRHHLFRTALSPLFVKPRIESMIPEFESIAKDHNFDLKVVEDGLDLIVDIYKH